LLARISAKRTQDSNTNSSTPVDNNSPYQLSRPPTGSLRVDTSSLDTTGNKQNKSAYPTYASNGVGVLKPTSDNVTLRSPVPVTAGPDFGRQSSARNEIVGYNVRQFFRLFSKNMMLIIHSEVTSRELPRPTIHVTHSVEPRTLTSAAPLLILAPHLPTRWRVRSQHKDTG